MSLNSSTRNSLTVFILFAISFYSASQYTYAQSNEELTSQQIFEEIIQYYDPDSSWTEFSGRMQMTSLRKGNLTTQEIYLNNKTTVYECIRNREDGTFVKGVENGTSFFEINGEEMTASEVPEKYQKYPYSLSEHYAQTYVEHHTFHFSLPLALNEAEALPLDGVGRKYLFGQQCVSIKFNGYPNSYEKGYYNDEITLYAIPEKGYKLHAVYFDNGKGPAKEGMLVLMDGEIEIGGIKIPASKITFFDRGSIFFMADAFQDITDSENSEKE